jgi:hypothetical protein
MTMLRIEETLVRQALVAVDSLGQQMGNKPHRFQPIFT